jgi:hypothetical protein
MGARISPRKTMIAIITISAIIPRIIVPHPKLIRLNVITLLIKRR